MWRSSPHSRRGVGQEVNLRVQVAPFLPDMRHTGLRWTGTSADPSFIGVMATRPSTLQDGDRRAQQAPHAWSGLPGEGLPVTSRPWPLFPGTQGHAGPIGHLGPPVLPKCVGQLLGWSWPCSSQNAGHVAPLPLPPRACASRPTCPLPPWRRRTWPLGHAQCRRGACTTPCSLRGCQSLWGTTRRFLLTIPAIRFPGSEAQGASAFYHPRPPQVNTDITSMSDHSLPEPLPDLIVLFPRQQFSPPQEP